MSRYNEVYQCTWDSEDFKSLSKSEPNAQTLWLYLLTGKHKTPLPGIYNIGLGALEDFLKWSRKALAECFQELSRKDMAKVDFENNVIYLPNWYKWNKPQNPNVLKGWLNLLDNIPNCEYKYLYYQQLKSLVESLDKSFHKVLSESFPTPKPEPIPVPKPKPDIESGKKPPQAATLQSLFASIKSNFTEKELKNCEKDFIEKMTEKSDNGKKERWQKEKTFDVNLRFKSWIRRDKEWHPKKWEDDTTDKKRPINIPKTFSGWEETDKKGKDNLGHIIDQYHRFNIDHEEWIWYCPKCDKQFKELKQ